ncbi:MAG TPA: F0F1 ATP synthase subunit epsilon [Elusimicrobiales bacterium]|nr:F0F1 ATP synthase subunit epsilon [Elusimicrobiales bacterium]
MTKKKRLRMDIVTPERPYLQDREVDFVVLPAERGEMGVLPGHAPFAVQLRPGVLRYREGSSEETFAVMGGFAEVYKDKVSVFAEAAELAREVDEERARQEYAGAKAALSAHAPDLDMEAAQASLRKAAVRLKVAELRRKRHPGQK